MYLGCYTYINCKQTFASRMVKAESNFDLGEVVKIDTRLKLSGFSFEKFEFLEEAMLFLEVNSDFLLDLLCSISFWISNEIFMLFEQLSKKL